MKTTSGFANPSMYPLKSPRFHAASMRVASARIAAFSASSPAAAAIGTPPAKSANVKTMRGTRGFVFISCLAVVGAQYPKKGSRRMPNTLRFLGILAASCATLSCQPAPPPESPPHGQLGRAAVPVHYGIELTIDPSKDEFSGSVDIDVTLAEPRAAIWLHGKDLKVSEAYATDSRSGRADGPYAESS